MRLVVLLAGSALALACGGDLTPAERGARIYAANCAACHHPDPARQGTLGPPIASSSRELIEARVLRVEYPPGYTPKADTKLMVPLRHLSGSIDDLHAFLSQNGAPGS